MRPRTLPFRSLALLGVGWVQFVLVGPGVHDPDCVHHRPGATGAAHVHEPDPPFDEECRCLGLCVPGSLVGLTVPQARVETALPPALAVASVVTDDDDAVLPSLPGLLPPSTGPPQTA